MYLLSPTCTLTYVPFWALVSCPRTFTCHLSPTWVLKNYHFISFSRPPSASTELTLSSSASAVSTSSSVLSQSGTRSKIPPEDRSLRAQPSSDHLSKSDETAETVRPTDPDLNSPPSYELAVETSAAKSKEKEAAEVASSTGHLKPTESRCQCHKTIFLLLNRHSGAFTIKHYRFVYRRRYFNKNLKRKT